MLCYFLTGLLNALDCTINSNAFLRVMIHLLMLYFIFNLVVFVTQCNLMSVPPL